MKIYTKLSALALLATPAMVVAQDAIFYSNGATVSVMPSSTTVMTVNGKLTLDNASQFINDGQIEVKNSINTAPFTNNGDFEIKDATSTSKGSGKYIVEQDWNNNGIFTANTSEVLMPTAGTQKIKGNTITTFHDLSFNNLANQLRIQEQHAKIDATGTFNLNVSELATQGYFMEVLNPSTAAIAFTAGTGFVSSLGKGKLFRATNDSARYIYPVGVAGTYRPVQIKPTSTTPSEYGVAFVNKNATLDGYDLSENDSANCSLNSAFYHRINKIGTSVTASIDLNYLPTDGAWTGMSQWNKLQANKWNSKGYVDALSTTKLVPFTTVTRASYPNLQDSSDHVSDPFVLGIQKPAMPLLAGPPAKCGSEVLLTFIATGSTPSTTFTWNLPAGVTSSTNPLTNDTIVTNWTGVTSGIVSVNETFGTCKSDTSKFLINSYAAPVAAIDTMNRGTINDIYSFMDSSKIDLPEIINTWAWTFADGDANSTQQNPSHLFSTAGDFPVQLIVTSSHGCKDTATTTISIKEGIKYSNVFSPNGDGSNDFFTFPNIGLDDEFKLEIFDRWGLLIFETSGKNVGWDGRTLSGKPVSDGTYYYVLQAKSAIKNYDNPKGIITVMK
jgi:gliding motility-associated-like protein